MTQVHPEFGLPMTAAQYADEWEQSAAAFFSAGHYKWMNEQLGDADKVIEIGCGSGASTEALVAAGRHVLVIESNQYCVDKARERLDSKGISTELISIGQLNQLSSWGETKIRFLVGDILSIKIEQEVPHGSFDAVVCWMTGSHPEHVGASLGKSLLQLEKNDMSIYRSKIQNRCYEVGSSVLKNKGLVHIVDRAIIRSWGDKDLMRQELARILGEVAGSSYSLTKGDCYLRRLKEGLDQSSIQYVVQLPAGFGGEVVLTSARSFLL